MRRQANPRLHGARQAQVNVREVIGTRRTSEQDGEQWCTRCQEWSVEMHLPAVFRTMEFEVRGVPYPTEHCDSLAGIIDVHKLPVKLTRISST